MNCQNRPCFKPILVYCKLFTWYVSRIYVINNQYNPCHDTCSVFMIFKSWWRHQVETSISHRWIPLTHRPVTRNYEVFFDLRLNKRLSKQSRRRWFEMSLRSLWRHWRHCLDPNDEACGAKASMGPLDCLERNIDCHHSLSGVHSPNGRVMPGVLPTVGCARRLWKALGATATGRILLRLRCVAEECLLKGAGSFSKELDRHWSPDSIQ